MDILEKIVLGIQNIGSIITRIGNIFVSISNGFIEVISTVVSIFSTLWFGIRTLFVSVIDLVRQLFEGELFYNVGRMFNYLSIFIGTPATIFLATLFLVVIVRIGISFVFKLLRLNANYNSLQKKNK